MRRLSARKISSARYFQRKKRGYNPSKNKFTVRRSFKRFQKYKVGK